MALSEGAKAKTKGRQRVNRRSADRQTQTQSSSCHTHPAASFNPPRTTTSSPPSPTANYTPTPPDDTHGISASITHTPPDNRFFHSSPSRFVASVIPSSVANALTWPARVTTTTLLRFCGSFKMASPAPATASESAPSSSLTVATPSAVRDTLAEQQFSDMLPMHSPLDTTSSESDGLSSPLSNISRSPTPPSEIFAAYPSPMSSQLSSAPSSSTASPAPDSRDDDESPPAKRRRISQEPKPRIEQHLNLHIKNEDVAQSDAFKVLRKALERHRKIVVVAGAGISVSAGIPDFRSSKGLFKSLKKQHNLKSSGKDLFDASVYQDANATSSFHQMVRQLSSMTKAAEPTPFHHLLATLADEGRLLRLYTQNVDGIDTALEPLKTEVPLPRKGPWPKTIQLHGGLQQMVCSKCHHLQELNADLFDGPDPPACGMCEAADNARTEHAGKRSHGIGRLRPRMVLYNEHNPDDEAIGSVMKADMRTRPDCLIVVGTTLKIPGVKRIVKEMCSIIRNRRDGTTVWINKDPPPPSKDFEWDLVIEGPCDAVTNLVPMRRWYEPKPEEIPKEEVTKIKSESVICVEPPPSPGTPQKVKDAENSIPTPMSSRSTSVPLANAASKINFAIKSKAEGKNKAPTKRKPKTADPKKVTKAGPRTKYIKKSSSRADIAKAAGMKTLDTSLRASKTSTTVAAKTGKKASRTGTPVHTTPVKVVPMRPVSPVDAKLNPLGIIAPAAVSPEFSPITPNKVVKDMEGSRKRVRKASIDFILN